MKNLFKIAVILLLGSITFYAHAQTGNVKLRGTKLTYPLFRRWISEFNKVYPNIKVEIAQKAPADSIDLSIASYKLTEENYKNNHDAVTLVRYAQLPIANSKRPDLNELTQKGFTQKDFKQIYFQEQQQATASTNKYPVVIYRREISACASVSFARQFGNEFKDIKGVPVAGDDKDLLNAVKRDVNGLSYNNLGFVYDLKTRKVVDSIAVIPIDLNNNGKVDKDEKIYGTLDEVIAYIEKTNNPNIPVEGVNVIFSKDSKNKATALFLNWVLTEGQKYNHEYGFLNQENDKIAAQKEILAGNFKN
jgi:phosphate transport system substrate-binding protein